jgi:hypothetical protein
MRRELWMNRTSIEEIPSGERELKGENESSTHGFMRTKLRRSRKSMEEEKDFGERRRKISGKGGESFREERECKFQKNGCLDTRIVEFGIANRE